MALGDIKFDKFLNSLLGNQPITRFMSNKRAMLELYGLGLRQIGRLGIYKPYPEMIDKENPYQRGYRISDLSLFSGEDGQSILEHVARFTVQCGE